MKKIFNLAVLLLTAGIALAQQPTIHFDKQDHDFGKINEADGKVTTVFYFKNEGMSPLVLSNVRASCGCTTPKWTRQPIEPGQAGEITVTYNPNGRPGNFTKTITVTSNADQPTVRLTIRGQVIPKPAKPIDSYPVKMGALSLKAREIHFGDLMKNDGQGSLQAVEYANLTGNAPIRLGLLAPNSNYMECALSLDTVPAGKTGKLNILFNADKCPVYGPVTETVYLVINDTVKRTDEYRITVRANLREDFSKMSDDELRNAPIAEMEHVIDFGTIFAGKKAKQVLTVGNAGAAQPLAVRRVVNENTMLKITAPKNIRCGKKGDIKMELNTAGMEKGQYSRKIAVIVNDPKHPVTDITVKWTVE